MFFIADHVLISLLFLIGTIAFSVIFAVCKLASHQKKADAEWRAQTSQKLQSIGVHPSDITLPLKGRSVEFTFKRQLFNFTYIPGYRSSWTYSLNMKLGSGSYFYIGRKDRLQFAFSSSIGGNIQGGDPAFDSQLSMNAEPPEFGMALVSDRKNREILKSLFATTINSLEINNRQMIALWDQYPTVPDENTLKVVLDCMIFLRDVILTGAVDDK